MSYTVCPTCGIRLPRGVGIAAAVLVAIARVIKPEMRKVGCPTCGNAAYYRR